MEDQRMLKCGDCEEELPEGSFAKNPAMGRGRDYVCRECTKVNRLIRRLNKKTLEELKREEATTLKTLEVLQAMIQTREVQRDEQHIQNQSDLNSEYVTYDSAVVVAENETKA